MSNSYYKELPYREVSKKVAYHGKRVTVEELEYTNGEKKLYREHVRAGNAAVILPITEDRKVIMVQEPRTPIGKMIVSLPAGMIEKGEDAAKAAIRELEEETGYRARQMRFLRDYYSSIGYSDEKIEIYLATHMEKTKQQLDEGEDIQIIELPLEEVVSLLDKNEIKDASTIIALMHYLRYNQ